jgi:predicted PurR-regulated permease PerM
MSTVALPRPAERVAIVSLFLVFLCGSALGAIAMKYWERPAVTHNVPSARDGMLISVKEWKEQLNLTEEQTRQLTSILDDFSHYYDTLMADLGSRVVLILNEDQKQRYRQLIDRHKK